MSEKEKLDCRHPVICDRVKSSVAQAMSSYETYVGLCQQSRTDGASVDENARKTAKEEVDANFDFVMKLLEAGDEAELAQLQKEHSARMAGILTVGAVPGVALEQAPEAEETLTGELDSGAIAAGITGGAVAASQLAAAGGGEAAPEGVGVESEIEALAAKIHKLKGVGEIDPGVHVDDAVVAEMVAEVDAEAEALALAAEADDDDDEFDFELDTDEAAAAASDAQAPEVIEEVVAEVEAATAVAQAEEAARKLETETEATTTVSPFNVDLAAQLAAVKAMIRS